MAESAASKQKINEKGGEREEQRAPTQGGGTGLQRRGYVPSIFTLGPRDFFTTSPLGLMRRFADEMDRAFSNLGNLTATANEEAGWMPAIEVRQTDNNLIVSAELPGLTENDVKVETTSEGLVIQGERQREYSGEEGGVQRSERSYGRFWRLVPLPEGANIELAKASFENGVLQVVIPIPESQQKRRQIPISGSAQTSGGRARSASQGG